MKNRLIFIVLIAAGILNSIFTMEKPVKLIPKTKPAPAASHMNKELGKQLNNTLNSILHTRSWTQEKRLTDNDSKMIRDLIAQNADVNYMPEETSSSQILKNSVLIGDIEIFKLILTKFTDIPGAREALIAALLNGELEMAQLIINKFNINTLDRTATLFNSHGDLIFEFLDNAKQPFISDTEKRSNIAPAVKFLIDHNLNSLLLENTRINDGKTPLMIAAENGFARVVHLLLSSNIPSSSLSELAKSKESYLNVMPSDVVKMATSYINPIADIRKRDNNGKTALDLARRALQNIQSCSNRSLRNQCSNLDATITILEAAESQRTSSGK